MSNVLEFPRPKLRLACVSFRDFLRWRYGLHYNGLAGEWTIVVPPRPIEHIVLNMVISE